MRDTPHGEVRNRLAAPAVTVETESGRIPLDDYLASIVGGPAVVAWADITGKPATFAPAPHQHPASDITGLAAVATTGAYGDLTGQPSIPDAPGDIGAAPASHTHTAAQVSDATATGRAVMTAADAAGARTAIGAGTSSLALGTTGTTAAAGNHTHTATQVTATAIGPGTATTVQGILAELAARIAALEPEA